MIFKVSKIPSDELSLKNCLVLNPSDMRLFDKEFNDNDDYQSKTIVKLKDDFYFGICKSRSMKAGTVGLSAIQRKWVNVGLEHEVELNEVKLSTYLQSVIVEVDFLSKQKTTRDALDTDKLSQNLRETFAFQPFTIGQEFVYKHDNFPYIIMKIKELKAVSEKTEKVDRGVLNLNSQVVFDKKEESILLLSGKAKGKSAAPTIINPNWDFSQMGIGGLDKEFSAIFRRAFASRVFPPELIEDLCMQHVKGILLYGPPGTGKTLMARQIGKMLNAREPKIVNGPEILNKYVGESEANIRKLFEDAENDQKKYGANSGLHMIIFDEIDAICKQRGTVSGSTGVADTVVNQLLSKIDGVEQLNNILVIGMTNRKDLIDEALLRSGRLEVQMEIGLPNEDGRLQIIEIHTSKLYKNNKVADDVDLKELAASTKNFSGAELEGMVRAATTTAMNRLVKAEGTVKIDPNAIEELKVRRQDFIQAIEYDVKPSFGAASDDSEHYLANGIIKYGSSFDQLLLDCQLFINQTKNGELVSPVSVLLEGPVGSGKTALAAHLAYNLSAFPFIKVVSPEDMIGFSENAKCQAIKKIFDDAYKSELSCIIVDDIERLLEYVPIGPRFSNVILQSLMVLFKKKLRKGKKLLVIGTTSCRSILKEMGMLSCFSNVLHVPSLNYNNIMTFLLQLKKFSKQQMESIEQSIDYDCNIPVKNLINFVEMASQADNPAKKFIELIKAYKQQ